MKTCAIIGHRKIDVGDNIGNRLACEIEKMVLAGVKTFLFGSRSEFNDLCYEIVCELKKKYSKIERVYVRAEYPKVNEEYSKWLNLHFEKSYYYDENLKEGRLKYIKRNEHLIDACDLCLFYYNENYLPKTKSRSGTRLAYDYALKKKKKIINVKKQGE